MARDNSTVGLYGARSRLAWSPNVKAERTRPASEASGSDDPFQADY